MVSYDEWWLQIQFCALAIFTECIAFSDATYIVSLREKLECGAENQGSCAAFAVMSCHVPRLMVFKPKFLTLYRTRRGFM